MEPRRKMMAISTEESGPMTTIGIAADHGGFELKQQLIAHLTAAHYQVKDFGAHTLVPDDDYPDFIFPLAIAVSRNEVSRGLAICGSGIGACVAANKIPGIRACLITDSFSAHQGVEDDNLNIMCLGGLTAGKALAWELVQTFLHARFKGSDRFKRRLLKISALENKLETAAKNGVYKI